MSVSWRAGRAAAQTEGARQVATLPEAAFDALVHGAADALEPGVDLFRRSPGVLVGVDDLGDGQPGCTRDFEQLVAGRERVLDRDRVLDQLVGLGGLVADDEAAADGVELLDEDLIASCVKDGEEHPVGVERQQFVGFEDDVAVGYELDRSFATEIQFARLDDPVVERVLAVRVDGLRLLALEAPDHGPVGVVAAAGRGERAKELAADAGDAARRARASSA